MCLIPDATLRECYPAAPGAQRVSYREGSSLKAPKAALNKAWVPRGNCVVGFGRRYGVLGVQGEDAGLGESRPPACCAEGYETTFCGGGDAHPKLTLNINNNKTYERGMPK